MPSPRWLLVLALAGPTLLGARARGAEPPPPAALAAPEAEIEGLIRERLEAASRGDAGTWRRHVADDCLWTGPGLVVGTTAEAQAEISANAALPKKALALTDFRARAFGDVVVATYVSNEPPVAGAPVAKRFRKTDTYQRRGGSWMLIAANEVFVPTRVAAAARPGTYDDYLARYELDASHVVRVWREGDRLLSQGTGEERPTEMLPAGGDTYFTDGEPGDWIFGRAADGRVDRLIFRMEGGEDVVLHRLPGGPP
jgi:ketosteroid isomerase-like protein